MAGSAADPSQITISGKTPVIVFHRGFKESPQKLLPSILVSQKYYDPRERQRFDEEVGENVDVYVEADQTFAPARVYGCQVTLTSE